MYISRKKDKDIVELPFHNKKKQLLIYKTIGMNFTDMIRERSWEQQQNIQYDFFM